MATETASAEEVRPARSLKGAGWALVLPFATNSVALMSWPLGAAGARRSHSTMQASFVFVDESGVTTIQHRNPQLR